MFSPVSKFGIFTGLLELVLGRSVEKSISGVVCVLRSLSKEVGIPFEWVEGLCVPPSP